MEKVKFIEKEIAILRQELLNHQVYQEIEKIEDLQVFLQYHVFAVWDFMSLLKALQQNLTCTQVPWFPKGNPITRRLINEIVLGEESDIDKNGNPASHYELYIQAIQRIGTNTQEIEQFVTNIQKGNSVENTLNESNIDESIKQFILFSFEIISSQKPHLIASAFTFGREEVIPDMFTEIIKGFENNFPKKISNLIYYFERHIELDGEEHGPMTMKMIDELCDNDSEKWTECLEIAKKSLKVRIQLWNGILKKIQERKMMVGN